MAQRRNTLLDWVCACLTRGSDTKFFRRPSCASPVKSIIPGESACGVNERECAPICRQIIGRFGSRKVPRLSKRNIGKRYLAAIRSRSFGYLSRRQYRDAARHACVPSLLSGCEGSAPLVAAGPKAHRYLLLVTRTVCSVSSKRTPLTPILRYGSITLWTSMIGVGIFMLEPLHQSRPAYSPPLMTAYDTLYQVG